MNNLFDVDFDEIFSAGKASLFDPEQLTESEPAYSKEVRPIFICLAMIDNYNDQLQKKFSAADTSPTPNEKSVPIKDIPKHLHFQVSLTNHPIIISTNNGHLCYKPRPTSLWLKNAVNLNDMWEVFGDPSNPEIRDDFMQFYRDIGYTLGGFEEIWGEVLDRMEIEKEDREGKQAI